MGDIERLKELLTRIEKAEGPDVARCGTRDEVQPYFRAFMVARRFQCACQADNFDYMIWIQRQWDAFAKHIGVARFDGFSRFYGERFGRWLAEQEALSLAVEIEETTDRLARQAVEGVPRALIANQQERV